MKKIKLRSPKNKLQKIFLVVLVAVAVGISTQMLFLKSKENKSIKSNDSTISLSNPFLAWGQEPKPEGVSFLEKEARIAAYAHLNRTINLSTIKTDFKTVEEETDQFDEVKGAPSANQPQIAWSKTYDSGEGDYGFSIAIDSGDNAIVTGISCNNDTAIDWFTIKYDSKGNLLWSKVHNSPWPPATCPSDPTGIAVDSGDNVIVTGNTYNDANRDFCTIKYDPDGNELWKKIYDSGNTDSSFCVAVDSQDNVIVAGYSTYYVDTNRPHIIKYDPDGNILWNKTDWTGGHSGSARGIAVDSQDNVIVACWTYFGSTDHNYCTIKYDPNGNEIWTKVYDAGYDDCAHGVAVDSSDNVIVTGITGEGRHRGCYGKAYDYLTVKYDPQGNILWSKTYNSGFDDWALDVAIASDDSVIVAGYSCHSGSCWASERCPSTSIDADYFIIGYDSNGNVLWKKAYDGGHNDRAYGVALDSGNNILVTGYSSDGSSYNCLTIKWWREVISELAFKLSLDSGLNMVSLPLKPEIDFTARTFAEKLSATTVISYNTAKDKFVPFVPEVFSGDGFLIEGGKGYIVNLLEKKDVVFTGTGWSNTTAAPSKDKSWHPGRSNSFGTTWAFVITGTVFDEDGEPLEDAPLYSVVENPQDHKKVSCLVGKLEDSKFAIPLVDMNHKAVVSAGEPLKVYVQDAAGKIVSGPITHRISVEEIKRGYAKFNLRLGDVIPEKSALLQNYPNPFNPETWIPYQLANRSSVTISIYNLSGKMVRTLNIGKREAGLYLSKGRAAYWDGKDSLGQSVASGVYFYTIKADDFSATRKMILIK